MFLREWVKSRMSFVYHRSRARQRFLLLSDSTLGIRVCTNSQFECILAADLSSLRTRTENAPNSQSKTRRSFVRALHTRRLWSAPSTTEGMDSLSPPARTHFKLPPIM